MVLSTRRPPADFLDRMVYYLVETPDGTVGVIDDWNGTYTLDRRR